MYRLYNKIVRVHEKNNKKNSKRTVLSFNLNTGFNQIWSISHDNIQKFLWYIFIHTCGCHRALLFIYLLRTRPHTPFLSLSRSHTFIGMHTTHKTSTCFFCRFHFHTGSTNTCLYHTNILSTHTNKMSSLWIHFVQSGIYVVCIWRRQLGSGQWRATAFFKKKFEKTMYCLIFDTN